MSDRQEPRRDRRLSHPLARLTGVNGQGIDSDGDTDAT